MVERLIDTLLCKIPATVERQMVTSFTSSLTTYCGWLNCISATEQNRGIHYAVTLIDVQYLTYNHHL